MILFVAQDAGPAAYLAEIIKNIDEKYICISSPVSSKVFDKYRIKNSVFNKGGDIKKKFGKSNIEVIVTGTSLGESIDKDVLRFGKYNNITVISVIEHWSFYRERFISNNQLLLPDHILVNNRLAKAKAVDAGLPGNRIHTIGNPVLEKRASEVYFETNREEWLESLGIHAKQVIAFISENYSSDFSPESENYHGFDEFEVIEDVLGVIKENEHLLIKIHPQEIIEKYSKYNYKNTTIICETDIYSMIKHSDFLMGMGSMLLLEAATMREDVISYRPNDKNGFVGNEIGATFPVNNKKTLREIFDRKTIIKNMKFGRKFSGSKKKIIEFIKEKLQ